MFKIRNLILVLSTLLIVFSGGVKGESLNIKNDQFWNTTNGKPIYSQGGGIFTFVDSKSGENKYFWYGAYYREAELYRNDPSYTQPKDNFVAVTCYSSTDLVNWTFENYVLDTLEVNQHYQNTRWMGRLGVAHIKELDKYAMFIQHNDGVLIALSDSPTGPFTCDQRLDMTSTIGTPNTGDQTLFTDDDTGISYLIYSYGRGRNKIYISEIGVKKGKVGLLDCTQVYKGKGREGNCMVKYNGKYYLFASNLYGWDSSYAYYLVSDNIRGPYLPTDEMLITPGCMDDYAHITQTGFFIKVHGSLQETVIYCGDRWANFAGNGLGYNQWSPMSFDGKIPFFNSLHSWNLNAVTGQWSVADDNNYVKNGSFEADRRHIPSPVKPIQEQLKGWITVVLQGNVIVVGDESSPILNYFNTRDDRKFVIGEKSLNIEDKVAFKRKIYQTIASTPYVELAEGMYKLTAKVKYSGDFNRLEMYAESGSNFESISLINDHSSWVTIVLDQMHVKNQKVEIGFVAEGASGASCQIDDVTFVKLNLPD